MVERDREDLLLTVRTLLPRALRGMVLTKLIKRQRDNLDLGLDNVNRAISKWRLHRDLFAEHERRRLELEEV